ncbi:MAG TPA: glycosyltransferase [Bryobacteraceae bacterium]|nr:glycosyltransferase [Bryobacteraceae bacterium]
MSGANRLESASRTSIVSNGHRPCRRFRILHVLPTLNSGGAENMACSLATSMARDHDIGALSLFPEAGSWVEERLHKARIPMWHLDKRPGFDARIYARLDRALREFRPDVVHSHMSVLRYLAPSILRRRMPAAIHTLHNLAEYENDTFGRALQWLLFRGAVVPVAISREVEQSFERVYRTKCPHLVPNCIPVESYRASGEARARWRGQEGIPEGAVVFTSTARFVEQKNPLLMIEAFARLGDPRARMVLMGRGDMRDQVVDLIRARGLEESVHLLGYRPDVAECLAASDVFVLSSNWEGNPLAVMEAMAAGLPVISTNVGGLPSLVESGRSGILVPAGDCAAFTEAMRFLADDAATRAAMSAAARAHAAGAFPLDRMIRGYSQVYEWALARR